jgi:S-DNA-T family DNA segregation ATPase FtsK/SpoIIIE
MAKRKHITYDSNETKVLLSILLLTTAIFFLIAFFTEPSESNFLGQGRQVFGDASILLAVFFTVLGLKLVKIKTPFQKISQLIILGFLILLVPAFLTSISIGYGQLDRLCSTENIVNSCNINCSSTLIKNLSGGVVGCEVIKNLFAEKIPVNAGTRLFLFLAVVLSMPIFFSIPIKKIFNIFILALTSIQKVLTRQLSKDQSDRLNVAELAETFGDFNKIHTQNKINSEFNETKEKSLIDQKKNIDKEKKSIEIKEVSLKNESLQIDSLKYPKWKLPPLSLLIPYQKSLTKETTISQNAKIIEKTLSSFGVDAHVVENYVGPSVVMYALSIPLGTKVEKIINLSANLALALGVDSHAVRIDSIPETTYLGIEVPRAKRDMVRFKELMESSEMKNNKYFLPIPIGKNIDGSAVIYDIQKLPHLLIAGATGSGKSVLTNSFISSLLMNRTPDELRLILVDPKQVELIDYDGIPHLLTPVITEMDKVVNALKWLVNEMETRYSILAEHKVRNIQSYNEKKGFSAMPFIVVVIDEMADMMMTANKNEAEVAIVRIAQKARAVGIHLILATQRPSVNVITGIIKANIPGRIGMSVTSGMDSRVILDRVGSESLMGRGDLLFKAPDKTKPDRLQASNIEQEEITRIVDFIKSQAPQVEYLSEVVEKTFDEDTPTMSGNHSSTKGSLLEQAIRVAVQYNKGSSSFIQRKLSIGFNKAAEVVEQLEELGVLGPQIGQKPREVLISDAEEFISRMKDN